MNIEFIKNFCEKYNITNYTINDDRCIDVNGDVLLYGKRLNKLPINFNKVSGYFNCSDNFLTSLDGCPKEVGSNFNRKVNKLTTLEQCPSKVGGFFHCSYNQLTSLVYSPNEVYDSFICYGNKLTSLEGSPIYIAGDFGCFDNPLNTLKGIPEVIEGDLYLGDIPIKVIDCSSIIVGDININVIISSLPSIIKKLPQPKLRILFEHGVDYNIFDKDGNVNDSRLERMFKDFNI